MNRPITVADWRASRYQKKLIKNVLESGRLTYGPVTAELEKRFADIHNFSQALFTSSGTMALVIAIQEMKDRYGWKDGDEIIMPALTFVATLNAITYNNLKPVLVDVSYETLNINPELIEKAINKKTRAIVPVHLLGLPADMDEILDIARAHELKVIEDSCETMFIDHSHGDVACYSTYLAHVLVAGIGGFICTDDGDMARSLRSRMFHGRDDSYLSMDDNSPDVIHKRFLFDKQGYSARATELEAAIGLGELQNWPDIIEARQANAGYIQSALADVLEFPGAHLPHAYMLLPLLCGSQSQRDKLMLHLEQQDIHTRTIMPLTNQPIIKKLLGAGIEDKYPTTKVINQRGLLIGCHQYLSQDDLDYVVATIREFFT